MGADKDSGISFPNYRDISKAHKIKYMSIKNNNNLSNKIKDVLYTKAAQGIDNLKPNVASSMFADAEQQPSED